MNQAFEERIDDMIREAEYNKNLKTSTKLIAVNQQVKTGEYHEGRWSVLYTDGTTSQDINENFLNNEFSDEFVNLVRTAGASKYIPTPTGANKESHLHKWPQLIIPNAPKVKYMQEEKSDMCISKALSSVLQYAGFNEIANSINRTFVDRKDCFQGSDPNFKKIAEYAKNHLPKWLQYHSKKIHTIKWTKIRQFDIFVAGILGNDRVGNHAVAIYNNWIFDSNEKIAIPLCKDGLDYCVSTKVNKFEFQSFTSGFFFRERSGSRIKLKRKLEDSNCKRTQVDCRDSCNSKKKKKVMLHH